MESYKGNSWLNLPRISEHKTHLSKKTGPAQCKCGRGATKREMNQVKVADYIGVKELSAIFVAKFKCLNLLFALALEPFLYQAACARVIEMGRDDSDKISHTLFILLEQPYKISNYRDRVCFHFLKTWQISIQFSNSQ